jgi:hypothetical protein
LLSPGTRLQQKPLVNRMKIYLETSFISACVTNRTDPSSLHRKKESLDWWTSERQKHQLILSSEVITELSAPTYPLRIAALHFIKDIPPLMISPEAMGFAGILIDEQVMPQRLSGDAIHVAVATLERSEYILSWNVKHLANPNKRVHLAKICMRLGFVPPIITTPEFLWEN